MRFLFSMGLFLMSLVAIASTQGSQGYVQQNDSNAKVVSPDDGGICGKSSVEQRMWLPGLTITSEKAQAWWLARIRTEKNWEQSMTGRWVRPKALSDQDATLV